MNNIKFVYFTDINKYLKEILILDIIGYDYKCTKEWYLDRYQDNLGAVAVFKDEFMIGYAFICGIKQPYYQAIKNGVLIGDVSVSEDMYSNLNSQYLYLSSAVVIPSERGKGLCTEMTNMLLEKYYTPNKSIISFACLETETILTKRGFTNNSKFKNEKYKVMFRE